MARHCSSAFAFKDVEDFEENISVILIIKFIIIKFIYNYNYNY